MRVATGLDLLCCATVACYCFGKDDCGCDRTKAHAKQHTTTPPWFGSNNKVVIMPTWGMEKWPSEIVGVDTAPAVYGGSTTYTLDSDESVWGVGPARLDPNGDNEMETAYTSCCNGLGQNDFCGEVFFYHGRWMVHRREKSTKILQK